MGRRLLCVLLYAAVVGVFQNLSANAQDVVEPVPQAKGQTAELDPTQLDSTKLLPTSTKLWISVPDLEGVEANFEKTQIGQLAKNDALEPFFESLKSQARDWLDQKNVRLGIQVEDLDEIQSGEMCIAGVLQDLAGGQPARGSHGLVMLVDVSKSEDDARKVLTEVREELLKERQAVQEKIEINGIEVVKITIQHPKRIRHSQVSFQTVHNGWLVAADNEEIFRDIMQRLSNPAAINAEATLAEQPAFKEIRTRTVIEEINADVSWFVDPFGYIKLAQAIEQEESAKRAHQDDWARTLEEQGFDAIRGAGGRLSLATGDHELLHRAYIYAPRENLKKNQARMFDLFDFDSAENGAPAPAPWVPADAAGYFGANWNFSKLLSSLGYIYDAFLSEGEFDQMLKDFKADPDMQLDIPKLVGELDNRLTIISTTERPISETSERVVIGLRIKGDPDFVFESIKRAVGQGNGEQIMLGGIKVIEVDTTKEPDFEFEDDLEFLEGLEEPVDDKAVAQDEREFQLFEKRYFATHNGYLMIANNKDYFKKILLIEPKVQLNETEDYNQVKEALDKLVDPEKISFRQFGRMDRALETNYEMLREGKMGQSQTVLARVLNKLFETEDETGVVVAERQQKVDGSKLPENYEEEIAPFLGPTGWTLETEKYGWRLTGCILKKKQVSEVVKKVGDAEEEKNPHR